MKNFLKYLEDGRSKRNKIIDFLIRTSNEQYQEIEIFMKSYSECIEEIEDLLGKYCRKIDTYQGTDYLEVKRELEREFFIEADVLFMFFVESF